MKSLYYISHLAFIGYLATVCPSASAFAPKRPADASDLTKMQRVTQEMVAPPFLPVHTQVAVGDPKIIQIKLVIEEKKIKLDDEGTETWAFTFNGTVPAPIIVAHEGDYIEATIVNPATNSLAHNIDFHAATGGLGGGALTDVAPGEEVMLRFKATKAGVFVYHCAPHGIMIPWHVVKGMNGAIMILPREGLKDGAGKSLTYDRAYYIGEQDFYVAKDKKGNYKKYATAAESFDDDIAVMKTLLPSHVVFNGAVGALTGEGALKANVGETVLFIHAQANRDTRPHIIGGHGDYVWERGSLKDPPATNLETWFIAGGSAGAALYKFLQPGIYAYVNHNLIEAVLLGATAHVKVEGKWNDDLMKQMYEPRPIQK